METPSRFDAEFTADFAHTSPASSDAPSAPLAADRPPCNLPPRFRRTQVNIKALNRLRIAQFRVEGNISRHPLLPNRLADLLRPVRLVAV